MGAYMGQDWLGGWVLAIEDRHMKVHYIVLLLCTFEILYIFFKNVGFFFHFVCLFTLIFCFRFLSKVE